MPSEPLTSTMSPGATASATRGARARGIGTVRAAPDARQAVEQPAHLGPGGEDQIDPGLLERCREFDVGGARIRAQFQHVAQNRDPPPAGSGLAETEHVEGGAHRGRACIVALVDQRPAAHIPAGAAAGGRAETGQDFGVRLDAERFQHQQNAERIERPVGAGGAQPELEPPAPDFRRDVAAGRVEGGIEQHRIAGPAREPQDIRARVFGGGFEAIDVRRVGVEHGGAARLQAREYLRLGVGDLGKTGEKRRVRGRDGGHQRRMRADQAGKGRDFARVVHAELEDGESRLARQAGKGERGAPLIVEIAPAGFRGPGAGEQMEEQVLAARLADAAGDRRNTRRRAGARSAGKRIQARARVRDTERGHVPAAIAAHHRRRRPAFQRLADEAVPVMVRPGHGHEKVAGRDRAAVDGDARGLPASLRRASGGGGGFAGGPERHAACSASCRATARSSNG